jgi:hypothetical protein
MAVASSILVLGTAPALTWATGRCLRRAGHLPHTLVWHRDAPAAALKRLAAIAPGLIMAVDGDSAILLAGAQLPACLAPDPPLIATLHDPWNLVRLLHAIGLPAPDSMRADSAVQLREHSLVYPIVTRPLTQHGGRRARLHHHPGSVARWRTYPVLAQSYVPGLAVGASFVAREGQVLACSVFRHGRSRALRFYASVRVRDYVERLAAACHYSGAGHLALRYNPARDSYAILGLRAGFDLSLLHAARAGINFPALLLQPPATLALPKPGRIHLPRLERTLLWTRKFVGSG